MRKVNKDIKTIKKFIVYLDSDNEKYSFNKNNMFEPYNYSKEIIDFFMYWNESNLIRKDYETYFKQRNYEVDFNDIKNKSTEYIVYAITYLVRRERFYSGLVAYKLNELKKILEELVVRLENYNKSQD